MHCLHAAANGPKASRSSWQLACKEGVEDKGDPETQFFGDGASFKTPLLQAVHFVRALERIFSMQNSHANSKP